MPNASTQNELSPEFSSASRLSRVLAVILRIGFWCTLLLATALIGGMILSAIIWPLWPLPADAVVAFHSPQLQIALLSFGSKLGVAATFLIKFGPSIVALHYGQRAFARFARGEVFTLATIADIRAASLWMVAVSFATSIDQFTFNAVVGLGAHGLSFNPGMLFFGLCTYIAAYVMAEARRIADDNASFV